jgi:hypothetical protein
MTRHPELGLSVVGLPELGRLGLGLLGHLSSNRSKSYARHKKKKNGQKMNKKWMLRETLDVSINPI